MFERIWYRVRQFWDALSAVPEPEEIESIRAYLLPAQMELFLSMPASDQAHSLRVFKIIQVRSAFVHGDARTDLLVAALLHDVGKSRYPLHVWERVTIVLAKRFIPEQVRRWGELNHNPEKRAENGDLKLGWRKAFIIAEQHPGWGAEMAAAAGASRLAVELIRRHQENLAGDNGSMEDILLRHFQLVDNSL